MPRSCLTPAIKPDQQKAEQRVLMKLKAEQEGTSAQPRRRTRAQQARDRERQQR
jgi:hypothetical protein